MRNLPVITQTSGREINEEAGALLGLHIPSHHPQGQICTWNPLPSTLTASSVNHPHFLRPAPDRVLPTSHPPLPSHCTDTHTIVHTHHWAHTSSCSLVHTCTHMFPQPRGVCPHPHLLHSLLYSITSLFASLISGCDGEIHHPF